MHAHTHTGDNSKSLGTKYTTLYITHAEVHTNPPGDKTVMLKKVVPCVTDKGLTNFNYSTAYFMFKIRGVPIIGSAKTSAIDMVIFTSIGISTEQQEDQYRY